MNSNSKKTVVLITFLLANVILFFSVVNSSQAMDGFPKKAGIPAQAINDQQPHRSYKDLQDSLIENGAVEKKEARTAFSQTFALKSGRMATIVSSTPMPADPSLYYDEIHGDDDCFQWGTASFNYSADHLRVGYSASNGMPYYLAFMTFRNVDIPKGSTIDYVELCWRAYAGFSNLASFRWDFENSDNAEPCAYGYPGDRSYVNQYFYIPTYTDAWTAGSWYGVYDLSAGLQEVIDRPGWSPGNNVGLKWEAYSPSGGYRDVYSYDYGSSSAPYLYVEYTPSTTEHCYSCPTYDVEAITPTTNYLTHYEFFGASGCRWYRFDLIAGITYVFTTCEGGGSYSDDTVFVLYDGSCSQVAENDDTCGLGSQIEYTPAASGYHYLKVANYYGNAESYTLAYRQETGAYPDIRVEPASLAFTSPNDGAAISSARTVGQNHLDGNKGPVRGKIADTTSSIVLPFSITADVAFNPSQNGDHISLAGFSSSGAPGDPQLPAYRFTFLLPKNISAEKTTVVLENIEWEDVSGEFDIAPVKPPATSSPRGDVSISWVGKDEKTIINGRDTNIYSRNAWFPSDSIRPIVLSKYRQWNLGRVTLYPIRYNPLLKKIQLLRSATLVVHFERQPSDNNSAPDSEHSVNHPLDRKLWDKLVPDLENPDSKDAYYPDSPETNQQKYLPGLNPSSAYIIITTNMIRDSSSRIDALVNHKNNAYQVHVITEGTASDDTHYASGYSCQQRVNNIRNWLKTRWDSLGIAYVLLIGNPHPTIFDSTTSVPMMMAYPYYGWAGDYEETPTDMCFAELSGDWDRDGDGFPGEHDGDFGSGGIDRDPEISVGRIPFYGSMPDLDRILQKIIDYETSGSVDWRESLLIPAAISNHAPQDNNGDGDVIDSGDFPDLSDRTFGTDWGETMKSVATGNGYDAYTLYEKSGYYTDGTAYSLTLSSAALTQGNLASEWGRHYGFVAWWGHGSSTGAYRRVWAADSFDPPGAPAPYDRITQHPQETDDFLFWGSSNCSQLDDDYPSIVVQVSCTNGKPESSNNLGYALLKNGAIGTVSASRVSWYLVGAWDSGVGDAYGDNASYAFQIIKRMIENDDRIGESLNNSKRDFGMDWDWISWMNCLDFNLYGDPSITHKASSVDPTAFTIFNDGNADLEISNIIARDGGAWLDWSPTSPLTLPPGGSRAIAVSVDWDLADLGLNSDAIIIYSNDPDETPLVDISAQKSCTICDTDDDGIPDDIENSTCTNPENDDTDGDGLLDGVEDANQDGVRDEDETNPCDDDTDDDGMTDGWEIDNNTNPLEDDAREDYDLDGFSNLHEFLSGSHPWDDQDLPAIIADFATENVVDGSALSILLDEFGRDNCDVGDPCDCDVNDDEGVDDIDLFLFSEDYGRIVD